MIKFVFCFVLFFWYKCDVYSICKRLQTSHWYQVCNLPTGVNVYGFYIILEERWWPYVNDPQADHCQFQKEFVWVLMQKCSGHCLMSSWLSLQPGSAATMVNCVCPDELFQMLSWPSFPMKAFGIAIKPNNPNERAML